jgi:hypothetical protein
MIYTTMTRFQTESGCEATVPGRSIPTAATFGTDPKGMMQILTHPYAHLYQNALEDELNQVLREESVCVEIADEAWRRMRKADNTIELLDSMVHFKMKFKPDGAFDKPKCRIVVRGDQQESGSAGETYVACPRRSSFRLIVATMMRGC